MSKTKSVKGVKGVAPVTPEPVPVESLDATLGAKLASRCAQYRDLSEEIAALKAAQESTMKEIRELATANGLTRVAGDTWLLTRSAGQKRLSAEKLLEQGVAMQVIEAATVRGASFYKVLGRKQDGGDE